MNIYDYFTTNFARFGLSIYKFSADMHGGAMNGVPLLDFSKTYTDNEYWDMIGLDEDERNAINNSLPNYYTK